MYFPSWFDTLNQRFLPAAAGRTPTAPAVVLFEELGNVVIAGITSNTAMKGIPLTVREGAIKDSVIKPNYIFTVSHELIAKKLFALGMKKKRMLYYELVARLSKLEKE